LKWFGSFCGYVAKNGGGKQEMRHHLSGLAHQPDEQARYALETLERERGKQVVSAALAVLTQTQIPQARPILLRLYAYYDEAGVKRDAGGDLRTALLGALLPISDTRDQALVAHCIMGNVTHGCLLGTSFPSLR
jgi:hypothetical protein